MSARVNTKKENRIHRAVSSLGHGFTGHIEAIGQFFILLGQFFIATFRPPYRWKLLLQQMEFVGFGSLFIIILTGFFTGAIFSYQSAYAFGLFGAESLVGSTVAIAVCRELGPVLTSLMVAGRVSSGMATILGTMRVTEQIDAMKTMAVDPVQYLIVPRVWACILLMPVLTAIFDFVAILGSYIVGVGMLGIEFGAFDSQIEALLEPSDVTGGLIKALIFGLIVSFIGCYRGFYASGGAKGVGEATTASVVSASILTLLIDYFLTVLIW